MPISVEWINPEHTVILYRVVGVWTWDDFHAANQTFRDYCASEKHVVDVICDFSDSNTIPPRVLSNMGRVLRQKRLANVNQVITVGISGLMRNLADVLRTLYPVATAHVIDAHTFDHALRLLSVTDKR